MKLDDIIQQVADEMSIPFEVCRLAYMSSWKFILEKVQALPLTEHTSMEEFKQMKVNFNMPSLGKMHITEEEFVARKKRIAIIKNLRQKKDAESK